MVAPGAAESSGVAFESFSNAAVAEHVAALTAFR